jgi:hypothetical protein
VAPVRLELAACTASALITSGRQAFANSACDSATLRADEESFGRKSVSSSYDHSLAGEKAVVNCAIAPTPPAPPAASKCSANVAFLFAPEASFHWGVAVIGFHVCPRPNVASSS